MLLHAKITCYILWVFEYFILKVIRVLQTSLYPRLLCTSHVLIFNLVWSMTGLKGETTGRGVRAPTPPSNLSVTGKSLGLWTMRPLLLWPCSSDLLAKNLRDPRRADTLITMVVGELCSLAIPTVIWGFFARCELPSFLFSPHKSIILASPDI